MLSKNAPVNDRSNTFESVMNILGNLGPEYSDLVFVVTQPLIDTFYVRKHQREEMMVRLY